jgi:hypothetical protein
MSWPFWNSAAYWSELAVQTRKLADDLKDPPTMAIFLAPLLSTMIGRTGIQPTINAA